MIMNSIEKAITMNSVSIVFATALYATVYGLISFRLVNQNILTPQIIGASNMATTISGILTYQLLEKEQILK